MPKSDLDTVNAQRLHRATYTTDRKNGGYLIRVGGPYADKFAGREVPVSTTNGTEHMEKLTKLIWKGVETTSQYGGKVGETVGLYKFEAKPREAEPEFDF